MADSRKRLFNDGPESSKESQNVQRGSPLIPSPLPPRLQAIYDLADSQGRETATFKNLGFRNPEPFRWFGLGFAHGREIILAGLGKIEPYPFDVPEDYFAGLRYAMDEFTGLGIPLTREKASQTGE